MAEKTREQRLAEADKRISDFTGNVKRMYVFVEDVLDIYNVFSDKCTKIKGLDADEKFTKNMFDVPYYEMVNSIKERLGKEDIDPKTLDILINILYEDDMVDGRLMYLVMTCWCVVNVDKYPLEALSVSSKVYALLDD